MKKIKGYIIVTGFILLALLQGCFCKWMPSGELTGKWIGMQEVTLRAKDRNNHVVSTKTTDSVLLVVNVNENGKVEGRFGQAILTDCKIEKNRGNVGKTMNIKTDFIITGTLTGRIVEQDSSLTKIFTMPLNFAKRKLTGTLFHKEGFHIFPMSNIMLLKAAE